MRRLEEQFQNELVVIGVHSGKFPSEQLTRNIREAVMRHGIEHPVVNDAGFRIWNEYAVEAWPTLVLVDPRGRIAEEFSGEILAEELAPKIAELITAFPDLINHEPLKFAPDVWVEPERPLRYPSRLLAAGGALFIADSGHHRVLEVRLDADGLGGEITRVFGSGLPGLRDGIGASAQFHHPHGLGLLGGPDNGRLYAADTENHAVRVIDLKTGMVKTAAGTGEKAHGRLALRSPGQVPLRSPWAVLPFDRYVFIAMAGSHQIWVLIDEQQLGPFAGNGREALADGPVAEASFNQPSDLAMGFGYLFVADPEASAIRAISLDETPRTMTLVGQGLFEFGDRDGDAAEALLQHPAGLALEGQTIYVADTYNHKIKALDPAEGVVSALAGSGAPGLKDGPFEEAQFHEPEGVVFHAGRLYIADTNNHAIRVADLSSRQVLVFDLRGFDRFPVALSPEAGLFPLAEVTAAPGEAALTLDVHLPQGFKRSPDAPARLVVGIGDEEKVLEFEAGQPLTWTETITGDQVIPIDLTVYYCQDAVEGSPAGGLCYVHARRLVLPVRAAQDGGLTAVSVPYSIGAVEGEA